METIRGILTEIIFYNEENGYTVAEIETETELVTVVGHLPSVRKGCSFLLRGSYKAHPKYGEQFAFKEAEEVMPSTAAGIENFLASGIIKGIRQKTAHAIVKRFGDNTLKIMENQPERLTEISGIGKKTAKKIAESYALHIEFAKIALFFQEFGISSAQILRLYKVYGSSSIQAVTDNPYRLVEDVRGIGFRQADEIAAKMGIPADSPFRIRSGVLYTLSTFLSDGSTYVPRSMLNEMAAQLLDLTREEIGEVLVQMAFEGDVQFDRIDDVDAVYLFSYYEAEQRVTRRVTDLMSAPLKLLTADVDSSIQITAGRTGIHLSESQEKAVRNSLMSGMSIITGGPGTGKTTIINTLIDIFESGGFTVALAAPTGRAAKRITETSGKPASTIHRLLEYFYDDGRGDMQFGKTAEDPLKHDVLILDEASMIDLMLMRGILEAVTPGTRLILVGDADQLPSVGAGNVLNDLIGSGFVRTSRLTEIFRQAGESTIVVNAHRINQGEYPSANGKNADFFIMTRFREQDMQDLIIDLVKSRLPGYYSDLDPEKDIQVLTPVHKGIIGTVSMNKALQEALNPHQHGTQEKKTGSRLFRTGDKVMQTRNNYQLEWKHPGDKTTHKGVFNGDIGFICAIDHEDGTVTVVFDEDRYTEYDSTNLEDLELAYAITVHKSQGSEFPIVVMPVTWFPPMLATRNLLYTAITRGKKAVVLVGPEERVRAMVDNDRIRMRYSGLRYRLGKMVEYTGDDGSSDV